MVDAIKGVDGGPSTNTGSTRRSAPRMSVQAVNLDTRSRRSTAVRPVHNGVVYLREQLKVNMGNKEGIIKLEVRLQCMAYKDIQK